MADDILVRLRAEADTAQLKEFQRGLNESFTAARKAGLGLAEANKVVDEQFKKVAADAKFAGKSVQEYINGMLKLDAAAAGMRGVADAIKRVKKETEDATKSHRAHASAIGHVTQELAAMAAGYFAVHKVVHTVIESFQEFAKFDTELRKIQNNTGATEAEMQKLGRTFTDLSQKSGQSVEDLIGGFEEIREGAHLTKEQAGALMNTISQGAMAAQIPVKQMGDVLGSMMRNMQVEGADAGKVMDYMAAAAAHLRLDMGEMAGIMPRMTEVFSEMGYTGASGAAAMLSWASALRGVTKNSGEAGNAAARMLEQASGPGMAAALKMPQSELHRIIEMAKSEGTDVMSVITGMIQHRADTTGKSVNEILDKMTARERRLWRAATEGRNEVKKANEELANHSDGMSKRFADNFRKGPQQAINELAQSYEALKRKLGESLDKIGVTSGLKSTTTDLNRILELIELIERHGTYAKALMTDIVQGKWTTTSPELDKAKKDLDEAKKRIFDGYSARRSGEGSDVSDQERLEDAFGKSGGGKRAPAPSGMPGWTGRPLPMVPNLGGAQHFAGGGGFGGGGSIAGRNWQHDLLGGGAMSGNIEDRRNTEATRSNTEALKRLEDIIDDANVTKGGLADQLGIGSIGGGRGAGGRFGGTSGGRVGGGVGGGGGGGVAGAGSGGPGTGMGDSTAGGSGMDGLPRGPAAGQAVYDKMLTAFQGSDVVGKIPPGGERFGFKTGSAEEWAKFGTGVAKAESSFNPATSNLSDPGGSHGILQYAHGQVPGGNAHNVDASIAAFVRDAGKGGVTRGSLLGRRFSTIGSHPERTIKNMRDYTGSAGAAAGTNAGGAPPGGGGLVSHQGSGAMVPAELKMQMEYASAMAGVNTNIAHGMEPGHARHRPGAPAGDIDLLDPATGKKLDSSIPADRAKMSAYITAAAASGAKGIGMGGPGQYMGASRMHVGGGTPAVWGHGGSGANTPGWVREAYNKGIQNPVSSAQQQAAIGAAKGGTAVGFTNAVSKGTPVQVTSVTSDASKALTEAHSSAIDKATEKAATAAGGGADAGDDAGSAKDRANAVSRAQKAAGVDPSSASSPYGAKGFGKSGFGADHRTGKLDSELDTASGKGRQRGFGRSNFGGRHQEGELDSASGKRLGGGGSRGAGGKFDEELDSASGKKGRGHQSENATGSPAGLPKQASFNLDKTQFSRRDRAMDKAAQTALHQASENSHSDIGVA